MLGNLYKYIAGLFILVAIVLGFMYEHTSNKLERTESEKKALSESVKFYKAQLEKEHNDKVELDRKYKQLEEKAKADKNFDWYANISNSPVIIELQNN